MKYDLIIIGGGPGGYEAAALAARKGRKVALVEKDKLGGTCLNRGCVPTKCLCAAADKLCEIAAAEEFGVVVGNVAADYAKAVARAGEVVGALRDDVAALLADVDVINGEARLAAGQKVIVDGDIYEASEIIIATGSTPAPFPAQGGEYTENSDAFLRRETLPDRIAIVGGGVIGLEFASIIAAYGREVTVVEYCAEVLPGFDAEVAKRLRSYLSRRGVKIVTKAKVTAVDADHTVHYEVKGKEATLECDLVVSAVGRRPVLPEGLEEVGVALTSRGFIDVDEHFRTSAEGIYAIGDVNGKCMLAHAASAQARVVVGVADSFGVIPSVVFTNPECASVGLAVSDADGLKAAKVPYSSNAKAQASGSTDGLIKLVYREEDGVVVGCQAVGAHAGDLIAEAAIAIDAAYTVTHLAENMVSAHPSLSELLQTAAQMAR